MGLIQQLTSPFRPHAKPNTSLPPSLTFDGQTIIVTGATSGIGLEAAVLFTSLGASTVIITARTSAKGLVAKNEIEERTGRKDVVVVKTLDMDSFPGVFGFMADLKKEVRSIDRVVLNAGLHRFTYELLPSGWEADLQVNVLSTVLLGLLIMQWMREVKKEGQEQHLVFVGSGTHLAPNIEGEKWPKGNVLGFWNQRENFISGINNYGVSKLLLQYVTREIAKLARDGKDTRPSPIVNSVCPGPIKTNLAREFRAGGFIYKLMESLFLYFKAAPAEVGGQTLVLATTTTEKEHGLFRRPYMTDEEYEMKSKKTITSLQGEKMQAQVWKEIIGVLKEVDPEVEKIAGL